MINIEEKSYLDLLNKIITTGASREDRTGIGTKSIFGTQLRFSLENNRIPNFINKNNNFS